MSAAQHQRAAAQHQTFIGRGLLAGAVELILAGAAELILGSDQPRVQRGREISRRPLGIQGKACDGENH